MISTTDPLVDPIGPFSGVGPPTFDGESKFSLTASFSLNGNIIRGVEMTGTYTVNADCTGVLLLASVAPYDIVIVDRGREIYGSAVVPGRVYTFVGKR